MKISKDSDTRYSVTSLSILTVSVICQLALIPFDLQAQDAESSNEWRQWGGPQRNFSLEVTGLANDWPENGPRELWSRPLGPGQSAIIVDDGRLFTMYRHGNGRTKNGPWDENETIIAMDSSTGETLWEHSYSSPQGNINFSFGAGPHSTPLLVGDRLFTIGTSKQLYALDKKSGDVLWSHNLIEEFEAPPLTIRARVKAGYGYSPIAYRDTIIVAVGGPGQSLIAFRQNDGSVAWRSGDYLTSDSSPILITVDGQEQLIFFASQAIHGLDPGSGRVLWSQVHDPGNDLNLSTPLWGDDRILFFSSAYDAGSRAVELDRDRGKTNVKELWANPKLRFMFSNGIRIDDHVYGTSGDFGPAFMTAINVRTGEVSWQKRGFGRSSLLYADEKVIVLDEDGDLALTRLTPDGMTVLAESPIFETTAWTVPTLVGTTLYARDREKIVALDVGRTTRPDFSGTWRLNTKQSQINAPLLRGGGDGGPGDTLHITQTVNETLVVGNELPYEYHAWIYKIGDESTIPVGPRDTLTMTTRWEGDELVSEGLREPESNKSIVGAKEIYSLSQDGQTLAITVTIQTQHDTATNNLVFKKMN